jgi:hypothetical protein
MPIPAGHYREWPKNASSAIDSGVPMAYDRRDIHERNKMRDRT